MTFKHTLFRDFQPEKAIEDCDNALRCEPQNVKALFRKGQALKVGSYHCQMPSLRPGVIKQHKLALKRGHY